MSRGFVILKINESNFLDVNICFRNLKLYQRTYLRESGSPRRFSMTKLCKFRQNLQSLVVAKKTFNVAFPSCSVTFTHQNVVLQYVLGLMQGVQTMAFRWLRRYFKRQTWRERSMINL